MKLSKLFVKIQKARETFKEIGKWKDKKEKGGSYSAKYPRTKSRSIKRYEAFIKNG